MPSLNGIEFAGVIKARPNPPAVVVIISAGSDAEFERQCAAAGADFCVEKRHLQARLLAFLQQRFSTAWAEGVAGRRVGALRGASSTPHPAARRRAAWFLAQPEEPQDSDDDDDCADDVGDAAPEIIFRVG
jgi:DNA-binding NarL/FixJ family response regulator